MFVELLGQSGCMLSSNGVRRRSGNMSSKSGKSDPFSRAEVWLRQRKDAKIHALESSARSLLVRVNLSSSVSQLQEGSQLPQSTLQERLAIIQ